MIAARGSLSSCRTTCQSRRAIPAAAAIIRLLPLLVSLASGSLSSAGWPHLRVLRLVVSQANEPQPLAAAFLLKHAWRCGACATTRPKACRSETGGPEVRRAIARPRMPFAFEREPHVSMPGRRGGPCGRGDSGPTSDEPRCSCLPARAAGPLPSRPRPASSSTR
jgi:hypothetical protein